MTVMEKPYVEPRLTITAGGRPHANMVPSDRLMRGKGGSMARAKWDGRRAALSAAVAEYVDYIKDTLAVSTVENKQIALRKMLRVLGGSVMVDEVAPWDMTKVWLECGKTRGDNARIIDHQAYKHFFEWCADMEYRQIGRSPIKHIKAPKPYYKERKRVAVEKFEDLKNACITPRDRMFVASGLYMLCRKVELTSIPWSDVDRDAGLITITRFKTKDDDVLAISDELESELEYYEDWYKFVTDTPKFTPLQPNWFLIPRFTRPQFTGNLPGQWCRGYIRPDIQMDKQTGGDITIRALNAIGFPTREIVRGPSGVMSDKSLREGAHTLRRSGARALFDAEVDAGNVKALRHVQLQLGHKTASQTEAYIGVSPDRMERNERIRGKVMYPKAAAIKAARIEEHDGKQYGHLRVVG